MQDDPAGSGAVEPIMRHAPGTHTAIVVGAGIVGLSIALRLQLDGHDIIVVDKAEPMSGCSAGNAGCLSEANIFPPLTADLILRLPRLLFAKDGPVRIRPSYAATMLPWVWRAMTALRHAQYRAVTTRLAALTRVAIDSFSDLLAAARANHLLQRNGLLVAFSTPARLEGKAGFLPLWNELGLKAERLSANSTRELEPALQKNIAGSLYFPNSASCADPKALGESYMRRLVEGGARFVPAKALGFEGLPDGSVAVETSSGRLEADKVVIAAGYDSKALLETLGYRVPLASERGYHLMLSGPDVGLRRPVIFGEPYFAATPMSMGLRLAGTAEFAPPETAPDMDRALMLLRLAKEYLPSLSPQDVVPWMGVRPSFPDGMPAIGKVQNLPSIHYAFGHAHNGLTLSAITAQCVASLVQERASPVDIHPFALERFSQGGHLRQRQPWLRDHQAPRRIA
jgi:D-hydroxyproline dehydrogenase